MFLSLIGMIIVVKLKIGDAETRSGVLKPLRITAQFLALILLQIL
jgi:hypothetical protein